jgi:hypothetical protein
MSIAHKGILLFEAGGAKFSHKFATSYNWIPFILQGQNIHINYQLKTGVQKCYIWGSHSGGYEEFFLGCNSV